MADVTFIDPLGRQITLEVTTWYGHILKRHPYMRQHRKRVERAIPNAEEIRFSNQSADARLYYSIPFRGRIIIVVAADVVAGCVLTAYLASRRTGAIEWSKPKP